MWFTCARGALRVPLAVAGAVDEGLLVCAPPAPLKLVVTTTGEELAAPSPTNDEDNGAGGRFSALSDADGAGRARLEPLVAPCGIIMRKEGRSSEGKEKEGSRAWDRTWCQYGAWGAARRESDPTLSEDARHPCVAKLWGKVKFEQKSRWSARERENCSAFESEHPDGENADEARFALLPLVLFIRHLLRSSFFFAKM